MRVLFWGTPEFATPPLRALLGEGYDVVGVVTQPDKAQGRSRSTLIPSPVKLVALEEGLPVLQPEKPRGEEFEAAVRALTPDISVVVAYGHLLPPSVIELPPMGTVNIHASLLPRWRGAAPIQAAIRAGDTETGISIMRMVQRMDAGNVLLQAPTPIADDETYGELELRLSELGALALVEALTLLSLGATKEVVQNEAHVTFARKIDRAQAMIDWTQRGEDVARTIRAFDPRPGAFTTQRGLDVKLFGARAAMDARGDAGHVLGIDESGMLVACGEGGVRIGYVHPAGKRRLAALDYAQGRGVSVGDVFGDNGTA
ncbi:MAG: methionyl-tRNA formyltransferase [Gemmatimonadetes bacterium]|nr:methionyl-tRNA formyltransferase [Gemmatimonadota bacterium]MCC6774278.1 methionyl-tRNA formyltransferase [Gemmatimonadaceae bacterium]